MAVFWGGIFNDHIIMPLCVNERILQAPLFSGQFFLLGNMSTVPKLLACEEV